MNTVSPTSIPRDVLSRLFRACNLPSFPTLRLEWCFLGTAERRWEQTFRIKMTGPRDLVLLGIPRVMARPAFEVASEFSMTCLKAKITCNSTDSLLFSRPPPQFFQLLDQVNRAISSSFKIPGVRRERSILSHRHRLRRI